MNLQQVEREPARSDRRSARVVSQCPKSVAEPERTLRSIAAGQFKVSWTRVTPEARFVEDLGADSLDLLQLVLEIEEELDLEIPDEAGEQFRCMADVLAFISARETDRP